MLDRPHMSSTRYPTPGSHTHRAHRPLQSNLRIFFFRDRQMLPRQKHRAINGNRQTAMPAANHDRAQNQLAEDVPAAGETVCGVGQADTDADAAVAGDDFEKDVKEV